MSIPELLSRTFAPAFLAFFALAIAAAVISSGCMLGSARAQAPEIVVTSALDMDADDPECPSVDSCTLRAAIESANEDAGEGELRILFDEGVFPISAPVAINVSSAPLPPVTRDRVVLDASRAGVTVDGSGLDGGHDGLAFEGADAIVRGIRVQGFEGACIAARGTGATIGGDRMAGNGNSIGDCGVGILLAGEDAEARGNVIGFARDGIGFARDGIAESAVNVGIEIRAPGASVGGEGIAPVLANFIGNAATAIRIASAAPPVTGTLIGGNVIGEGPSGAAATVERGVVVEPGAGSTRIAGNVFANIGVAGTALPGAETGPESFGTTVSENVYRGMTGLAIDLGGDGIRNPNDNGDLDGGPNGMLNHPVIARPTQASISGIACGGCVVELYRAAHEPGAVGDRATVLIDTAETDEAGAFQISSPAVVPGEWVTATVTDMLGNTSEFSPSARVGVGAIQCGNVNLAAGWNHAGYFGTSTLPLGGAFPGDTRAAIRAVYELEPGGTFTHWFRDTMIGRTLTSLVPGRAYFFLVDEAVVLRDGFSLTAPLGVQLEEGWNDFVYFGATADVRDGLMSLAGSGMEVYRFVAGRWQAWGSEQTPDYARAFDAVESCAPYVVKVDEAAVLTPLHP